MNKDRPFLDACELLATNIANSADEASSNECPNNIKTHQPNRSNKHIFVNRNIILIAAIIAVLSIGIVIASSDSRPTLRFKRIGATIDFYLVNAEQSATYKYFDQKIIPDKYDIDKTIHLTGYESHIRIKNEKEQYADLCVINENGHIEIPINNHELEIKQIESQKYYYILSESVNYIVWSDGRFLLKCVGDMPIEELFDIIILF